MNVEFSVYTSATVACDQKIGDTASATAPMTAPSTPGQHCWLSSDLCPAAISSPIR